MSKRTTFTAAIHVNEAPQSMPEHLQTSEASRDGVSQTAAILEAIDNLTREVRASRHESKMQTDNTRSLPDGFLTIPYGFLKRRIAE